MMMRLSGFAASLVLGLAIAFGPGVGAQAQTAFCPPGANPNNTLINGGNANFALSNGSCTNGLQGSGAFSGAALASQALSDLTQSTTTETNRTTANAVANRRAEENARCTAGQVRNSSGECVTRARTPTRANASARVATPARAAPTEMRRVRVVTMKKGKKSVKMVMKRVRVAAPVEPIETIEQLPILIDAPRYGAFATGFSDYERRDGMSGSNIFYDAGQFAGAGPNGLTPGVNALPFIVRQQSKTRTNGFVGGIDMTFRNNFSAGDGAIFGLLAGYTDTSININTQIVPLTTALAPGASATRVTVRGPSVGFYATYFAGPFSIDHTLKIDFFRLNESFAEVAGFGGNSGPVNSTIAGFGSTSLSQVSSIANANYRLPTTFPIFTGFFIEPTVGYQYTASFYGGGGAQLGLRDGDLLRLQGGLRFGFDGFDFFGIGRALGIQRSTMSVTALAYENVFINGGFIQSGAFGSNVQTLNDAHKLRGQLLFTSNYELGQGFSLFTQSDVRTGKRYFAYGSKTGIRYEW